MENVKFPTYGREPGARLVVFLSFPQVFGVKIGIGTRKVAAVCLIISLQPSYRLPSPQQQQAHLRL